MTKHIDVSFGPFVGFVELKDPIPFGVVVEYEDALRSCQAQLCPEALGMIADAVKETDEKKAKKLRDAVDKHVVACFDKETRPHCVNSKSESQTFVVMLPQIFKCVDKWSVSGVPENPTIDTFPGTPLLESHKLIARIMDEIGVILKGNSGDPNASSPASTAG